MKITRKSIVSGITRTRDLQITEDQLTAYMKGALIQDAMPNLTNDEREFFITGIVQDEWEDLFSEEE